MGRTYFASHTVSARDAEADGIFVLLEFLTGTSIREIAARYKLSSTDDVEELLRQLLLRHGYSASAPRI